MEDEWGLTERRFIKAGEAARAKLKEQRRRNWLAVHAHNRKAGAMVDRKKKANKKACRGQVKGGE